MAILDALIAGQNAYLARRGQRLGQQNADRQFSLLQAQADLDRERFEQGRREFDATHRIAKEDLDLRKAADLRAQTLADLQTEAAEYEKGLRFRAPNPYLKPGQLAQGGLAVPSSRQAATIGTSGPSTAGSNAGLLPPATLGFRDSQEYFSMLQGIEANDIARRNAGYTEILGRVAQANLDEDRARKERFAALQDRLSGDIESFELQEALMDRGFTPNDLSGGFGDERIDASSLGEFGNSNPLYDQDIVQQNIDRVNQALDRINTLALGEEGNRLTLEDLSNDTVQLYIQQAMQRAGIFGMLEQLKAEGAKGELNRFIPASQQQDAVSKIYAQLVYAGIDANSLDATQSGKAVIHAFAQPTQ